MKKGQSALEIVLVAVCVIAVLLVMQAYIRRSVAGKIKTVADSNLGVPFDPGGGNYSRQTYQGGDSAYVTEFVSGVDATGDAGDTDIYAVATMVAGPQSHGSVSAGERDQMLSVSREVSEIEHGLDIP